MSRGVYMHIPFCLSKCPYCDFASRPRRFSGEMEQYLSALLMEISQRAGGRADTVYFGGGTPSLCSAAQIKTLLDTLAHSLRLSPQAEITLEMNPATMVLSSLQAFRQAGINRLSVGVQSTSPRSLRLLGRSHTPVQARATIQKARRANFTNVSCDLIYGLPAQSLEEFQADLNTLLSWEPDQISLYALQLESWTPMAEQIRNKTIARPDDDLAAKMYAWARTVFLRKGFIQYELSSFSRPDKVCRHNLIYWSDDPYIGLGVAAHSYEQGVRTWNCSDIAEYMQKVMQYGKAQEGREALEGRERKTERLMVGLQLTSGVNKQKMRRQFGKDWKREFLKTFSEMKQAGLLEENSDYIRLTSRGMLLADVVFRAII
ncbi:radical SAM family heme chaperone HemW [bacterium]|nr:radical SAM family heme chaperone HemW [bacterium]